MARGEHRIKCGGETCADQLRLEIGDRIVRATIKLSHLETQLLDRLSDVARDLIDIAGYVYVADAAISRGELDEARLGATWRRDLTLVVPVRRLDIWSRPEIVEVLANTLSFLSDDEWTFEFLHRNRPPFPEPLPGLGLQDTASPDTVLLFSGGLDSLGGALEELLAQGNRIALVTHRASTKLELAQKNLVRDLKKQFDQQKISDFQLLLNLVERTGRESSHRSRSFLFAAVGAAVADALGLHRICFFENGVLSVNLPISTQLVGARATRSTHPKVMQGFEALFSRVFERTWQVRNPFFGLTKTEVVERIAARGGERFIRHTRSCASVRQTTKQHPHCGRCSQCLDRRVAILAAELGDEDPIEAYAVDPVLGARVDARERELALGYVNTARQFAQMNASEFFQTYGEAHRVLEYVEGPRQAAAKLLFDLHRRHGEKVSSVVDAAVNAVASGETLPETDSLVGLVGIKRFRGDVDASAALLEAPPMPRRYRLDINQHHKSVLVVGCSELKKASAEFVITLAETFLADRGAGRAPEDYRLINAYDLAEKMKLSSEEAVRRRLTRLRNKLREMHSARGLVPPEDHEIIEGVFGKGYRLNPDHVDLIQKPSSQ